MLLHVYIIKYTSIRDYLANIHNCLACIHNQKYIYICLSNDVYIIRYANNKYVRFQMLHVSVQHCCWTSYQIAEQVTIVNLVALRGPSYVCVCVVGCVYGGMLQIATPTAWSIGRTNHMYVHVKIRATVDILEILWGMGSNLILFVHIHHNYHL